MNPALGPYAIAALLLVVAGALKAVHPTDTAIALERMGLPGREAGVRAGAAVELLLGLAALTIVDAVLAALVAVSYGMFSAFVGVALARQLPLSSCGCFGKIDTPPSGMHVGIGLGAMVAAIGMAVDPAISPLDVVTDHLAGGIAYAALVVVGVLTAFGLLTLLPRARAAARAAG